MGRAQNFKENDTKSSTAGNISDPGQLSPRLKGLAHSNENRSGFRLFNINILYTVDFFTSKLRQISDTACVYLNNI